MTEYERNLAEYIFDLEEENRQLKLCIARVVKYLKDEYKIVRTSAKTEKTMLFNYDLDKLLGKGWECMLGGADNA